MRWEQEFWMLYKEDDIKYVAEKGQNLQKKQNA
jgi:hypothetical protein